MTKASASDRIKVCLVAISLGKGGVERSCALLSKMLHAHDFDVHTIILNDEIHQDYEGELLNLGKLKQGRDSIFNRFLRIRKIRAYLKKNKIDFVIDHRQKNKSRREQFYSKYIYSGCERVYVVHSARTETYLSETPKKLASIYNQNYATVAVSNYIENDILKKNGIKRTVTIHNAYDSDWSDEIGDFPESLNGKKYILAYGRIEDKIKDFSFLLAAFEQSSLWKKDISLVILGDGPDLKMLKQKADELQSKNYIHFLGHTDHPFQIIKKALFTTLTSFYEGFPMVLVESLSMGTPIVSLDIHSGPSEIIKDGKNGLLVSERNIPLFAEALNSMIDDEALYARCKQNAKASVAQHSMGAIGQQWNNLLKNGIE